MTNVAKGLNKKLNGMKLVKLAKRLSKEIGK